MKMLPMKPFALTVALGLIAGGAAFASGYERISDEMRSQITAQLTAEGYEVRKIERDDGMIEVYALKDGQRFEIYLDKDLKVMRIKNES